MRLLKDYLSVDEHLEILFWEDEDFYLFYLAFFEQVFLPSDFTNIKGVNTDANFD